MARLSNYWKIREKENMKRQRLKDDALAQEVRKELMQAKRQAETQMEAWTARYANVEQVTRSEALKRASSADINHLSERAELYVKERRNIDVAFSPTANRQMREYNYSMRMSRMELLTRQIEVESGIAHAKSHRFINSRLLEMSVDELERQAGILNMSIMTPDQVRGIAETLVKSSYQDAHWSDRVWKNQDMLREHVKQGINRSLMLGSSPREWMRNMSELLTETFEGSSYALQRLAVTETGRVQIEAQKESYVRGGITHFEVITEPTACHICLPFDGKEEKVENMRIGVNAPVFHPNCRCSTAGVMSRSELSRAIRQYRQMR